MTRPEHQPDVPETETGEAYTLPELPPDDIAELEKATAHLVATVRDKQSQTIANLGNDSLPHFLVNEQGVERCGTDQEPWPCTAWTTQIQPAQVTASEGIPQTDTYTAGEVAAAQALGVTAAEVRRRMSLG